MTCRSARRLLPLFVGGDLKTTETTAVSAHVAGCAACRAEVEALAATLSLLPLSSLSFGDSERASLRRRVLDEIGRRRESPWSLAAVLARPRFAVAAIAGAIVIAASLVSPFLVRQSDEPMAQPPLASASSPAPAPSGTGLADAAPLASVGAPAISRASRTTRGPRVPAVGRPGPAMRLEIQTGNVNVRIIWFVGIPAEEPSSEPAGDPNGVS
jgi:hypothetical protein